MRTPRLMQFPLQILFGIISIALLSASQSAKSQSVFDGNTISLPSLFVDGEVWSTALQLTDPESLTFQLDIPGSTTLPAGTLMSCFAPYLSFDRGELVVPVLEVGPDRYQVIMNLVDQDQGLFQVDPASQQLIDGDSADRVPLTVWQDGTALSAQWGAPGDDADSYTIWYSPYPTTQPLLMAELGSDHAVNVELPPGGDYCLAVASVDADGNGTLSEPQRFTNSQPAYAAFSTTDASLPAVLFPDTVSDVGMALMFDADEDDRPVGAVITAATDAQALMLLFNPDHGLLSRLVYGDTAYDFVNYTTGSVDVIRTLAGGGSQAFPDLPLSNHAISAVQQSVTINDGADAGGTETIEHQAADWTRQGLALALDTLAAAHSRQYDVDEQFVASLQALLYAFQGDPAQSSIAAPSGQAEQDVSAFMESIAARLACGVSSFACASYAPNSSDLSALLDAYPEIFPGVETLNTALSSVNELTSLLNQDCGAIADPVAAQQCLEVQGNPGPGDQEPLLAINASQGAQIDQQLSDLQVILAQAPPPVELDTDLFEPVMELNQLYFEYAGFLGENRWVIGYFGSLVHADDGYAYLVDEYEELLTSEVLDHHSFARLDGNLPPGDFEGAFIMAYGEVKDFATESGLTADLPTPLITVSEYRIVNPAPNASALATSPVIDLSSIGAALGRQANSCDRALIISGGVNASNNKARYRESVEAINSKLRGLGFSAGQISTYYNNGGNITVDGSSVSTAAAGKQAILDRIAEIQREMSPSCTLTVFVSDHGTGQSRNKRYRGARPAFSGPEASNGVTHAESSFIFDARRKVIRRNNTFTITGVPGVFRLQESALGDGVKFYTNSGGTWTVTSGSSFNERNIDVNGDGFINESEAKIDFNGDGDTADNIGFTVAQLRGWLGPRQYFPNVWDYDGDGNTDVRLIWNATDMVYVVQRKVGDNWQEMGRDTNGDFLINSTDGGIDWNLDGDKNDQVAFYEGINLWGREVIWDTELAEALTPLNNAGIHILGQMSSCYSGGFAANLEGIVEYLFTGSEEDRTHSSFAKVAGSGFSAFDTLGFLAGLTGIDPESWRAAADAGRAADNARADQLGLTRNNQRTAGTRRYNSDSVFEVDDDGRYTIQLDIPRRLMGDVYDFEIIFGHQNPRWDPLTFSVPDGLPPGIDTMLIPGGFQFFSEDPLPNGLIVTVLGTPGSETLRLEYTDEDHRKIGYTIADRGEIQEPMYAYVSELVGSFQHFGSSSVVYADVTVLDQDGNPVEDAEVEVEIGGQDYTGTTDAEGKVRFQHYISQYGDYDVEVKDIDADDLDYEESRNVVTEVEVEVN